MEFEWDEAKVASSLAKHGITFNAAAVALAAPGAVLRPDDRRDYGELRWIALVETEITLLTIVLTRREDRIRIILARKANRHEHNTYAQSKVYRRGPEGA